MRRLIVISDLHIGGGASPMLGHPELLADFLEQVAAHRGDDEVELVIAGDFIDFLAEDPVEPWTPTEARALDKLEAVLARHALDPLWAAFARCAQRARLTILLGNHDIELAYPRVRDRLLRHLGTDLHRCNMVPGNEAYRVGEVLVEHGNRYDPWNAIDHDGLRRLTSAASRGEVPRGEMEVCPGSLLVSGAMTTLKEKYHFVDLLKPETELVGLLALEIEPTVVWRHLRETGLFGLSAVQRSYRKVRWFPEEGAAPRRERYVAAEDRDELPEAVRRAFHVELGELKGRAERPVGVRDPLAKAFFGKEEDGLRAMFAAGKEIPTDRLEKIRLALDHVGNRKTVFQEGLIHGECDTAAQRMVEKEMARVVVMGHTHLARENEIGGRGRYVNTGTWADLIQVGDDLVEDSDEGRARLQAWLRRLSLDELDGVRAAMPSYGDVVVNGEGRAVMDREMMRRFEAGARFG